MAETKTQIVNKPAWIELSTGDAEGSRNFYSKIFGWKVEVNPDPQYGGYGIAKVGGKDVAGIGPKQMAEQPTAWSVYIGTKDVDALAKKVKESGGTVVAGPMDVGPMGRFAAFQDPSGAFISGWQAKEMDAFLYGKPNTFDWAELNARGVEKTLPFYSKLFGWGEKKSSMAEGQDYIEFQLDGHSIAGATEMPPMVPKEVPSYWLVYFNVEDVDKKFKEAEAAGAEHILHPMDFPGGRFAVLRDPQGAVFAIVKSKA